MFKNKRRGKEKQYSPDCEFERYGSRAKGGR